MDPLLKKLNFKDGMEIRIWNCPPELQSKLASWTVENPNDAKAKQVNFLLGFVQDEKSVEKIFSEMKAFLKEDEIIWFCYPKKSSKRYTSTIHRDKGWKVLGENGYEGVRQVAIDEDWSALRFRHLKYIKSLTRKFSAKDQ